MKDIDINMMVKDSADRSLREYFDIPKEIEIPFTVDDSEESKIDFIKKLQNSSATFVEYEYSLSPKFDSITLMTSINVTSTDFGLFSKPEKILERRNLLFRSGIVSVIELKNPSKRKEENIAMWVENDAELVGRALKLLFLKSKELTPKILNMNASSAASLYADDRDKIRLRLPFISYKGRQQDHHGDGELIWTRYITGSYGYAFKLQIDN